VLRATGGGDSNIGAEDWGTAAAWKPVACGCAIEKFLAGEWRAGDEEIA
jgi:hypothetical protein